MCTTANTSWLTVGAHETMALMYWTSPVLMRAPMYALLPFTCVTCTCDISRLVSTLTTGSHTQADSTAALCSSFTALALAAYDIALADAGCSASCGISRLLNSIRGY